jgi:hypothetical protein
MAIAVRDLVHQIGDNGLAIDGVGAEAVGGVLTGAASQPLHVTSPNV